MTKTGDDILLYSIDGVHFDAIKFSDEALADLVKSNQDFAILRVNRVGHAGENYKFLNAVGEYQPQIAKVEGKNLAAAAGKEGVGGDLKKLVLGRSGKGSQDSIDLLKQSTCTNDDLHKYLSKIDSKAAEVFARTGEWPSGIQIPKSPDVLHADGSIKWEMAPKGGYRLDINGDAIKTMRTPQIGEIVDRNGPPTGRYTSPLIKNKPYTYEMRSLPYVEDSSMYHKYQVIGDFSKIKEHVQNCNDTFVKTQIEAYVTKWFEGDYSKLVTYRGEIVEVKGWGVGGGLQDEMPIRIEWLVKIGLLREIY